MAVLGVMASHLFRGSGTNQGFLVRSIGSAFAFGARGVDLFFVLSGFLITGILYDSLSDSGYFRKFYARRCLRIFPLYYGVLFALLLLTPWLRIQWQHVQWSLLLYLQNTNIIKPIYDWHSNSLDLNHFWSLAVEEQFYLVWPFMVFFLRDRKKILIACVVLSLSALVLRSILAFDHALYFVINCATACRADSLLIGGALALVLRGRLHDLTLRYARPVFWWTVVIMAALNLIRPMLAWHPQWIGVFDASYLAFSYTLLAVASAALIAWCLRPSSVPRSFFEGPVLSFFGKYSYGLYVLHLIIFSLIVTDVRAWIDHQTGYKGMGVAGAGILTFILSVGAAYLSYNLYEKKFLHLKRYFEYTRPKPPAAPSGSLPTHETLSSTS
jgi:peptidoglycan/LPS O-acetylase OafA/YrhL